MEDTLKSLSMDYLNLLINGQAFSDVTFNVEGRLVHAHRCILAARSLFFRKFFCGGAAADQAAAPGASSSSSPRGGAGASAAPGAVIPMNSVSYEVFLLLLQFLYSGQVSLVPQKGEPRPGCGERACWHVHCAAAVDLALDTLAAARSFGVEELVLLTQKQLAGMVEKASIEDVMKVLMASRKQNLHQLWTTCSHLVAKSGLPVDVLAKHLPIDVVAEIDELRLKSSLSRRSPFLAHHHPHHPAAGGMEASSAADIDDHHKIRRMRRALDSSDVELVKLMVMGEGLNLDEALALHYAVENCSREVVKALLELGAADVNHPAGPAGKTPLHVAAEMVCPDMVAVLLDHHADPNVRTVEGVTPLDILRTLTSDFLFKGAVTGLAHIEPNKLRLCLELVQSAAMVISREVPYTEVFGTHHSSGLHNNTGAQADEDKKAAVVMPMFPVHRRTEAATAGAGLAAAIGAPLIQPQPGQHESHSTSAAPCLANCNKEVQRDLSMEDSMACVLGDAVWRLLPGRLDGLLRRGYELPKGAEDEITLIKRDLEEIIAILDEAHSNSKSEDHAMTLSCLTADVREVSYDMEDFIDQCEHNAAGAGSQRWSSSTPRRCRKIIRPRRRSKTTTPPWLYEKLRQRLWMANKLREFSLRVQEALRRQSMCRFGATAGTSTSCTDDMPSSSSSSRHPAPYGRDDDDVVHVGIDSAMARLEWPNIREGKVNVVSIVGAGGVGKTTLANELYRKHGWQFECRAFVRTSQKPDIRRIFVSMLTQIRPDQPPDNWKVHSLISSIRTHLQAKRYLIVVDDIWATSTWDIIRCALPDGNNSSRILVTTEIEDLALQSSGCDSIHIFMMKPLNEDDSRKLFFSSLFGPQHTCPPELREASYDIVRKCSGLPLAIITIASLLASQMGRQEQWGYVNKSLGYSLVTNPTLEGLKDVLNLSYNSLPQHLKACLLYMSIYEEDNIVLKVDLVNQWIAEGFICPTEGRDKQEIAGAHCFDELIRLKMILPVDTNDNGEVLSCVVHHMVLNFLITYKSMPENFVTAIHHSQAAHTLADKVRRLSLHFGNAEDAMPPTNMRLSQLRTLAFFGVFKCMPSIVEFRLLQVLILHFWGDNDSITLDLTRISELFRLRYLKVASNVTLELETQIRGLQLLETLVIDARVTAVPSEIVHLPGLLNLRLPAEANLPNGIGQIMSLRTLGCFNLVHNSLENLQSLSRLSNLRDLQLTCCTAQKPEDVKVKMQLLLGSVLGELKNLKSLTVLPTGSYGNSQDNDVGYAVSMRGTISSDGIRSVFYPLTLLQTCKFSRRVCIFSCLPKFIGQPKLCILKIGVKKIGMNDVDVLRGLPVLAVLSLYVHTVPSERIVIGKAGFSVLRYFKFKCSDPWLEFEADAMPSLRKLKLCFNVHRADNQNAMPVGIEHLSGLKEVSAKIGGVGTEVSSRKVADAELAFRDAIGGHLRGLRVSIQFVNKIVGCTGNKPEAEAEFGCPGQYKIEEEDFSHQHDEFVKEESDEDDENVVAERERPFLLSSTPPGAATAATAAAQESRREGSRGGGSSSAASFALGKDPSLSDVLAAVKMEEQAATGSTALHQHMHVSTSATTPAEEGATAQGDSAIAEEEPGPRRSTRDRRPSSRVQGPEWLGPTANQRSGMK